MKKDNLIITLVGVISIILAMILLKDETLIPIHYNVYGEVDNYGSKYLLIIIGSLPIIISFLMDFLKKVDPNSANYNLFLKYYKILKYIIVIFLELLFIISVISVKVPINIVLYLGVLISVLFIGLGYIMPKVKQNYFVGIKTPWTLKDENVWDKTHTLGGRVFMGWGISFLIVTIVNNPILWIIAFLVLIGLIIFLFYYSYKKYMEIRGK